MISLSRHMELLLLEHNCVIVPGLGGFITNTASASYNDGPNGDKLFIPPFRTVGFNPQLQINDGLLVQSYMQAYDASYPAAQLQMEKDIEQLNMQLNLCGEYNLEGIGTLHKSLEQGIVLTSSEAGILTPALYGTYSFEIKSLVEMQRERMIKNATENANIMPIQTEGDLKVEKKDKKEDNVVPIKRINKDKKHNYWYDFYIASAASIIIFMAFLIPNIRTMNGEHDTYIAGTLPSNKVSSTTADANKSTTSTKTSKNESKKEVKNTPSNKDTKAESKVATTPTNTNVASTSTGSNKVDNNTQKEDTTPKNFTIVLASFVSEKNSNILIENLASQGLKEGKFIKKGKTTRVIYSAYTTEQEATNALLELRQQNEAFADGWTMKLN